MNILYLINHAGKGGTEKYVLTMARHCLDKNDKLFLAYNESGPLKEQMESLCAGIFHIPMKSPLDVKAAKALAKISIQNKIDIIHTQFARENYIAVLSKWLYKNKAQIIHTCHMITENNALWKFLNIFFTRENHAVIAVCKSVRDKLAENNYPASKIRLVHNGVKFTENINKSNQIRQEFNIGENSFIFISLARFSKEKGIWFLIKSAEKLAQGKTAFSLIIAGDGPLYNEAKEYIERKGLGNIIHLPGHRSDAIKLLCSSDCFINSSQSEALSFAILEAMDSGLPIIATNVGGNPDVINSQTDCGVLVEYGEEIALAKAMENFANNRELVEKMSANSRKAIKNIFNLDNSIVTTYNIYLEGLTYDNR